MTADITPLFDAGRAAWLANDLDAAIRNLRAALALAPDNATVRAALGAALLKTGNLLEGFPLFDAWRQLRPSAPALPFPRWRGHPVAGKRILVWSEDGFGDQIQWARFAVRLQKDGADISWLCPRPLASLFEDLGFKVLPDDQSVRLDGFDFYCPSSTLPLGFRLTVETLDPSPYLVTPDIDPRGARLGIMTQGNVRNVAGQPRALDGEQAARLLALPGAINLAPESTGVRDFRETAAIVAGLDLVITVDTAVAHLSAALGKPTWILLPFVGDWRWFTNRDDSPWYRDVRLFRQPAEDAWPEVVDAVVERVPQSRGN
jgi:hypothetical protein